MKALCIRIGVLGSVVVLGWITIAHGQRVGGNSVDDNPLRSAGTVSASPTFDSTSASTASSPARTSSSDPFGQRFVQPAALNGAALPSGNRFAPQYANGADASGKRNAAPAAATPTGMSNAGPSLNANDRSNNAQQSAPHYNSSGQYNGSNHFAVQSLGNTSTTSDANREPGRFRADPASLPAAIAANPPSNARTDNLRSSPSVAQAPPSLGGYASLPPAHDVRPLSPQSDMEQSGNGVPGDAQLEGVQSPRFAIQKFAPKEIQVGKPAVFRTVVRNTGTAVANDVEIVDQVPRGAKLIATTPEAKRGVRGELVWSIGTIQPGDEVKVEMQIASTAEGEIGSVATVRFRADASAKTMATRPQLVIDVAAQPKVMLGKQANLAITISNPGTGVATGIILEEHIPAGLRHPAGADLEYAVGDLKPGENRKLNLPLTATQAGVVMNILRARADGDLHTESKCNLEVIAPRLDIAVDGPKRRYLERQATYQLSVANPGTAPARDVELIATLPQGMKFLSANNAGYYEESTRTVRWRLKELQAQESGSVELVTMPTEAGQHTIRLQGAADDGLKAEREQPVLVEGLAATMFQVHSTADPIAVNGETTYEIHVANQGTKAATNVRLAVDLPRELKPLAAEGPTRFDVGSNRVVFESLPTLASKGDVIYRVRVKGIKAGDLRARFQLISDDMQTPVTKEESTRVYADD